jgi:hypothetical protein
MEKTNIFKTLTTIVIVTFTSIFITGCIPTTPSGNPTPSNQFDIYITHTNNYGESKKIIIIDGDSIKFRLSYGWGNWVSGKQFLINTTGTSSTFEILTKNSFIDSSYYITTVSANFNIPNDIDNSYSWITQNPIKPEWYEYNNFNFSFYFHTEGGAGPLNGIPLFSGFQSNGDSYIILRKLKGSSYQYYWIKINNSNALTILIGKYQLNSIITGQ